MVSCGCCGGGRGGSHWFCTLLYYVAAAVCLAYLIYCIVAIPQYRYVAIIIIVLMLILQFGLWRFLPSERQLVRTKAEIIAGSRLAGAGPHNADESNEPFV